LINEKAQESLSLPHTLKDKLNMKQGLVVQMEDAAKELT
jgi:hypothetical protein